MASEKDTKDPWAHDEFADESCLVMLSEPVTYDDEKSIRGLVHSPYVLGAALLASFGGFSFGYDQGVISLILVMPQFRQQYPETHPDSPGYGFHVGLMTGILELGAFIGCLFHPYVADQMSRKWSLSVATAFFVVGAVIQTASQNYDTLVAGRFIGGIGVGTLAMGAPLYISEIAPPNRRGSLLVLESISIIIGAILAYWITYGTRAIPGDWSFRFPFLLQILPALVVGCGIHFFPFSPRWLAMRGRNERSLAALANLRRRPENDAHVQLEWKGILAETQFQKQLHQREYPNTHPIWVEIKQWAALFRPKQWAALFRPKHFRRTLIALAIPFFQQFSGINAFVYYAPTFFGSLGQSNEMSLILSGIVNICQLVAGIPMVFCLDRIGRRPLAIIGGCAMAIPHLVIAGLMGKYSSDWAGHGVAGWICVALICRVLLLHTFSEHMLTEYQLPLDIYVLVYATSYGPLAWVLPPEVFSSSQRAKGVGAATAMIWLTNFIVGLVVPEMIKSIGWGTFLFFGLFCVAAAIFSFFLVPETSHKSLEQIEGLFGDSSNFDEQELRNRVAREVWTDPWGFQSGSK